MSFKEVSALRKQGKLAEALEMATKDLETNPDDLWNKRSMAWVLYAFLKQNSTPTNYDTFFSYLNQIIDLELGPDEKMVYDSIAFQIGVIVFGLQKETNIDQQKINTLFDITKGLAISIPSDAYSFIYKAFHKNYATWPRYLELADWWGFENFGESDFKKEELDNGISIMSLVEQAYIAYSKKLLEGESNIFDNHPPKINNDKIEAFLPSLENLKNQHKEYSYPPYFHAKLLLALEKKELALEAIIPFAKKKQNEFWVWDLLSEIFADDKEKHLACLCKALTCKTKEDFLIKTRQKLASQLVQEQKHNEAAVEIDLIVKTRDKKGWKIPNEVATWKTSDWYKQKSDGNSNNNFYQQHLKIAEELLLSDIPEITVAVEFVNTDKKILNFVQNKKNTGFFNYSSFIQTPKIGDLLKIRLPKDKKSGIVRPYTVYTVGEATSCEAIVTFDDKVSIREGNSFGFVGDYFIDPSLLKKNSLMNNQMVKGSAILSYNKKKETWGWKVFEIN